MFYDENTVRREMAERIYKVLPSRMCLNPEVLTDDGKALKPEDRRVNAFADIYTYCTKTITKAENQNLFKDICNALVERLFLGTWFEYSSFIKKPISLNLNQAKFELEKIENPDRFFEMLLQVETEFKRIVFAYAEEIEKQDYSSIKIAGLTGNFSEDQGKDDALAIQSAFDAAAAYEHEHGFALVKFQKCLGSRLIDYSQKMIMAAIVMMERKVWAWR